MSASAEYGIGGCALALHPRPNSGCRTDGSKPAGVGAIAPLRQELFRDQDGAAVELGEM
jgi:hypothetical protein